MLSLEAFFQSMLHCMAFDQVVSSPYSLTNGLDVHASWPLFHKSLARSGTSSDEAILAQRALILKETEL
jgi:hypothetical protein